MTSFPITWEYCYASNIMIVRCAGNWSTRGSRKSFRTAFLNNHHNLVDQKKKTHCTSTEKSDLTSVTQSSHLVVLIKMSALKCLKAARPLFVSRVVYLNLIRFIQGKLLCVSFGRLLLKAQSQSERKEVSECD